MPTPKEPRISTTPDDSDPDAGRLVRDLADAALGLAL